MVKVAFYKGLSAPGRDWKDKLICDYFHIKYSHVELIINEWMYSFSMREKSVRMKAHKIDKESWDYIGVENLNKKEMINFYLSTKIHKANYYLSSGWVGEALKIGGCKLLYPVETLTLLPDELFVILKEIE